MHILVADDHNLVRDGLKPFLNELDPEATILDAANFDEALAAAKSTDTLKLVLLDLKMPGMNGLLGVELMRRAKPNVPIVILSGHVEREEVLAAVHAGANGYIPKTISGSALINALRLVLAGRVLSSSQHFARQWSFRTQSATVTTGDTFHAGARDSGISD